MLANFRTTVFAPSLCLSTSSCPSSKYILLFLEQRPAHLRLALVQPGQRLYLGLDGVVHPSQMPYLGLDVVLHPGQRPYRQAWLELMMMQPQLLASSH